MSEIIEGSLIQIRGTVIDVIFNNSSSLPNEKY